jgi:hypothetical protein
MHASNPPTPTRVSAGDSARSTRVPANSTFSHIGSSTRRRWQAAAAHQLTMMAQGMMHIHADLQNIFFWFFTAV